MEREALAGRGRQLSARLAAVHTVIVAHQAELIALIAECSELGWWAAEGAGSVTDWVIATLNVDYRTAAEWVELARRLRDLPVLAKSFAEGNMAFQSVNAAAKLATAETDALITEEAEVAPAAQLLRAVKHQEALEAQQANPAPRASLRFSFDAEGWCKLSGWLPPETGATVVAAIERAADKVEGRDPDSGAWEPADTRMAEALVAMSETALGADDDPARATVVVHVDLDALVSGEGPGTLAAGGVVPAEVARRMACDGRMVWLTRDERGVVGIGRASRHIPAAMLIYLKHRDGGCRFPGCGRTRHLHAHHIRHWANDGETNVDNLLLACPRHHRLLHEGGWNAAGNPEPGPGPASTLRFIREDGTVYVAHLLPARPPGDGPAPPDVALAERLL
jgi:hypothetical protein